MPVDPGRHWLAAGITGLARQREWDAVGTADAPGEPGDEAELVALADGRVLVESGPLGLDGHALAAALDGVLERPFRAVAVRRPELWAVGGRAIQVAQLSSDFGGDEAEVVADASGVAVRIDGVPSNAHLPELEALGSARFGSFVVRVRRLEGRLFEVEVEPL